MVDQIDASNATIEYLFYNDRILTGFSDREINKQFDGVPRKATAQTVSSNRLFYGNYLDGFDNERITDAVVEVKYYERKEDFKSFNVKLQPSIAPVGSNGAKTSAFVLDCSELEDNISTGTVVDVKVTLAPDRNWHVYNFSGSDKSYHNRSAMGPRSAFCRHLRNGAIALTGFNQSPEEAGSEYLPTTTFLSLETIQGGDVSNAWFFWVAEQGRKQQAQAGTLNNIAYGTSA